MNRSELYQPLAAMLAARLKKSCPPVHFCWVGNKISCIPVHHKGSNFAVIYSVSSACCNEGLSSAQWDELVTAVFNFMERIDLCLDSLKL